MGDAVADRVDERTIVVAVDGSTASDAALGWAIAEAQESGRGLLLIYVLTVPDELATALLPLAGAPDAASFGQEVVRRAASRCEQADVPYVSKLVEGTAADILVGMSTGAGMLVLGGHQHDRPPPPASESVIRECLDRCRCPFVLVKAPG